MSSNDQHWNDDPFYWQFVTSYVDMDGHMFLPVGNSFRKGSLHIGIISKRVACVWHVREAMQFLIAWDWETATQFDIVYRPWKSHLVKLSQFHTYEAIDAGLPYMVNSIQQGHLYFNQLNHGAIYSSVVKWTLTENVLNSLIV